MNLGISLARNVFLQSIGKVVSIGLGWATVLILTNYLGAKGFGSYTIMTAYLQFFAVTADLGLVLVSSQLLAERPTETERVFANLLSFRLLTAVGILALAPVFIWLFPYSLVVKQGVVVLTLSFLLMAMLQVFTGLFQWKLVMGRAMVAELIGRIVLLVGVGAAVVVDGGLSVVVSAVVIGALANVSVGYVFARSLVKIRLAIDWVLWREIWRRSWPIAAGIVFNLLYLKADTLILSFVRPEAEVGVYGAMFRVFEVLITFPTMFASLLLPVLAGAWATGQRQAFVSLVQQSFAALVFAAVPMVVGVAFTAGRIVPLFGTDFSADGVPILILLVIATAAVFIGTLLGHVVVAMHLQRKLLWAYALTAFVAVMLYLMVIPQYGALGAAAMTIAAELLILALLFAELRRRAQLTVTLSSFGPALFAALPMALFLSVTMDWSLLPVVVGAAVLYLAALWVVGAVPTMFLRQLFQLGTTQRPQ